MTLATLRTYLWKASGDLVLYYKSNGRKPELEQRWAEQKAREASEAKADADAVAQGAGESATATAV